MCIAGITTSAQQGPYPASGRSGWAERDRNPKVLAEFSRGVGGGLFSASVSSEARSNMSVGDVGLRRHGRCTPPVSVTTLFDPITGPRPAPSRAVAGIGELTSIE